MEAADFSLDVVDVALGIGSQSILRIEDFLLELVSQEHGTRRLNLLGILAPTLPRSPSPSDNWLRLIFRFLWFSTTASSHGRKPGNLLRTSGILFVTSSIQ